MKRKIILSLLLSLFCYVPLTYSAGRLEPNLGQQPEFNIAKLEPIKKTDRILIFVPHPDDETLGCASIIQQAVKAGSQLHIVYMTNGDANQLAFMVYEKRITFLKSEFLHMGEVRKNEAIKAMKLFGLSEDQLIFLGYPDFGTFAIFSNYWHTNKPYKSLLTRTSSVPYKENFSYGTPYVGESLLNDFEALLKKYKPNKIFVTSSADVNFDHRAINLFLQIALADLSNNKELEQPKVYPWLIHWRGWPLPRHFHPELELSPPDEFKGSGVQWYKSELSPEELENKHQAILQYPSQTQSSAFYLLSFVRKNELFLDYPVINLYLGAPGNKAVPKKDFCVFKNKPCPVNYCLEGDYFIVDIAKGENPGLRFNTVVYLFGYNKNITFSLMPKIRIVTRSKRFKILDGKKNIAPNGVSLDLKPDHFRLKVPLRLLEYPDFLLVLAKAGTKIDCADTAAFRRVNIIKRGD